MTEKRKALVTGASQGLGAEIAVALARDGCDVAVSSRRVEKLSDTLGRIESAGARSKLAAKILNEAIVNNSSRTRVRNALGGGTIQWVISPI